MRIRMDVKNGIFYRILEGCGYEALGDYQMISLMKELARAKQNMTWQRHFMKSGKSDMDWCRL